MKFSNKTDNLAELRSRQVIRIGFALVMLIIGFVVIFGLGRISKTNDSLAEVVDNKLAAIEMLFNMQQSSRERSVVLYRLASTRDAFERDELLQRYSELGAQFGEFRRRLNELKLDEHEKDWLTQQREYITNTMAVQQRVIELAAAGEIQAAQELLNKQAIPAQEKILEINSTLLADEIMDSRAQAGQLQEQQGQTRILMVSAGIFGALFAGLIAGFVNRRMSKLIAGLASSAHELQEANHSLESLKLAVDHHDIVSIADLHGKITYVNEKLCQLSEFSQSELLGNDHRILNSGIHPQAFFTSMWHTISSGKVWQGDVCNRSKSGKLYWVYTTIVPFLDNDGLPYQYISVRTDITAIKEAQLVLMRGKEELEQLVLDRTNELREREEVLSSITNAAQDAVVMIDNHGNVSFWNPAAEKMFGHAASGIIGYNPTHLLVPARYQSALDAAFPEFVKTGAGALIGTTTEVYALRQDGSEFPIEISISGVKTQDSWHAVAIVRDITVRKQAEEQLKQLATTDVLTGAYNRRHFNEVLAAELARSKRYGTPFGMVMLDIDHFKHINDTYGHPSGDLVLTQLSSIIAYHLRSTDVFARWGGEEFMILLDNCAAQCPHQLSEKLRILIESHSFHGVGKVTCSFGVTQFKEGDDQASIIKRADNCLYRAKEAGRNRVESE